MQQVLGGVAGGGTAELLLESKDIQPLGVNQLKSRGFEGV